MTGYENVLVSGLVGGRKKNGGNLKSPGGCNAPVPAVDGILFSGREVFGVPWMGGQCCAHTKYVAVAPLSLYAVVRERACTPVHSAPVISSKKKEKLEKEDP